MAKKKNSGQLVWLFLALWVLHKEAGILLDLMICIAELVKKLYWLMLVFVGLMSIFSIYLMGLWLGFFSGKEWISILIVILASGLVAFGLLYLMYCLFSWLLQLNQWLGIEVPGLQTSNKHIKIKNLSPAASIIYRLLPEDRYADFQERLHRLTKAKKPLWFIRFKRIQYLLELFWAFVQIKVANVWLSSKNKIEK
ncbi:MAG: hypothetical protein KME17_07630 [Cyanosarcina radialis HA8281-LM2]|jgi:hypothetical protein|nr:hypothetical protein [Cyanosarcina radialis HA8281-LM2]